MHSRTRVHSFRVLLRATGHLSHIGGSAAECSSLVACDLGAVFTLSVREGARTIDHVSNLPVGVTRPRPTGARYGPCAVLICNLP